VRRLEKEESERRRRRKRVRKGRWASKEVINEEVEYRRISEEAIENKETHRCNCDQKSCQTARLFSSFFVPFFRLLFPWLYHRPV
jgi:hypothetical protein